MNTSITLGMDIYPLQDTLGIDGELQRTVSLSVYRRLEEQLAKTQAELSKQMIANAALHQEYVHTRDKLQTSQLANSMLRRLHGNERGLKFHKWLNLLEIDSPGNFNELMTNHVYSYCDWRTIANHRICCKEFCQRLPALMTTVSLQCQPDNDNELNDTGLNAFLLSLTSLMNIHLSGFYNTSNALLFARGLRSNRLVVLNLSESTIGPVAATELGRGRFPMLEILRIERNHLGSEGLQGLFNHHLGSKRIRFLQLEGNNCSANALGTYCDRGLQALGASLVLYRDTLEILDLSDNGIDDGGVHSIADGLSSLIRLSELKMRFGQRNRLRLIAGISGISDTGALALSRALSSSLSKRSDINDPTTMALVDLRSHRISTKGAIALVRCIHGNGRTVLVKNKKNKKNKKNNNNNNNNKKKKVHVPPISGPQNHGCRLQLHGNPTIGEAVIHPVSTAMSWQGTSEFLRRQISTIFGIWQPGNAGDDDDDKKEFRWKVRSRVQQKRRNRLKHL